MGASIDEPAANRCGVRGWASSFINRGNFVHSEGFAPLNQCPVARIPDLFALPMFKGFRLLVAVHGYGLPRQTQRQFPASGSVHEKGFALPGIIFIGTVLCQGFTPSLLSACPHPWVQYNPYQKQHQILSSQAELFHARLQTFGEVGWQRRFLRSTPPFLRYGAKTASHRITHSDASDAPKALPRHHRRASA